jgi:hypothetical protein
LYLVVSGVNVSTAAPDINKLCSVAGCRQDSLAVRVSGCFCLLPLPEHSDAQMAGGFCRLLGLMRSVLHTT